LTLGTFGFGTAEDLTIPDLGTLRAECTPIGLPSVNLNGGAPLFIVRINPDGGNTSLVNQTTYNSSSAQTLGFSGAELWLSNVQGQWRLEYYAFSHGADPCRVGAVITRIS